MNSRSTSVSRSSYLLVFPLLALLLAGCGEAVFDKNAAGALLNTIQVPLNSEQVIIQAHQIACGERDGLWLVSDLGGGNKIGRLTDEARELGFSDNIQIGAGPAHVQVNGTFPVRTRKAEAWEEEGEATRVLTASVGVLIDHNCFEGPLQIMGVNKGEFREDYSPRFRFQMAGENQWTFDRLIH